MGLKCNEYHDYIANKLIVRMKQKLGNIVHAEVFEAGSGPIRKQLTLERLLSENFDQPLEIKP